jgi:hypothetical protein
MDRGGNVERLEAALDVLQSRLDKDCLPTEPGEASAGGKKPPSVGHSACDEVRETLTFQTQETLHSLYGVVARLQGLPPFPENPIWMIRMKSEWFLLASVDQDERLRNALGSDDVASFAHDPQTAGARGGETIVRVHSKE